MHAQPSALQPGGEKRIERSSVAQGTGDVALLLLIGLAVVLLHVLMNGQYGFHRDELDILMSARQLDWGYISYPPLTPFIARIGLELFGPSLVGLRVFAAVAQGIVAILVGLMARDFGGGRLAQVTAVVAVAIAPMALTAGTLIQYLSFDYLWWVLLAFCTVRLLRSENARWWLGIGAAIGLGMMTKYTIAFFVAGLVVGVLVTPARRALRSRWLWAGVAVALLIFLPNLLWQIAHDFISLDFLSAIHARDIAWGRTDSYLVDQLYAGANPFTLPLWIAGLAFCLFAAAGRRFRLVGWMFVTTFGLMLVTKARGYYLGPAYPMLLAAGAAWVESRLPALSARGARAARTGLAALLLVGGIAGVVLIKPVVPINSALWAIAAEVNDTSVEMVGWPDLVGEVAAVYAQLPADEQPRTAILAGNYGEAGALELYGAAYGLPPVISGSNGLWARGYGDPPPETVIVVGFEGGYARAYFGSCRAEGLVRNQYDVRNEETSNHQTIFVCRAPRQPWPEMWATMQWFQ